jgi:hypothetical protein
MPVKLAVCLIPPSVQPKFPEQFLNRSIHFSEFSGFFWAQKEKETPQKNRAGRTAPLTRPVRLFDTQIAPRCRAQAGVAPDGRGRWQAAESKSAGLRKDRSDLSRTLAYETATVPSATFSATRVRWCPSPGCWRSRKVSWQSARPGTLCGRPGRPGASPGPSAADRGPPRFPC